MKYKSAPGIVLTSICGSSYLVTSKTSFQINETMVFYWKQLEKGVDETELAAVIMENYEVEDVSALHKEIDDLLQEFLAKHLIVRYNG